MVPGLCLCCPMAEMTKGKRLSLLGSALIFLTGVVFLWEVDWRIPLGLWLIYMGGWTRDLILEWGE